MEDQLSGETIVYTYDSLKRLTQASSTPTSGSSSTAWTQAYQYDGFGNLTAKVLNGDAASDDIGERAANNQLSPGTALLRFEREHDVGLGRDDDV